MRERLCSRAAKVGHTPRSRGSTDDQNRTRSPIRAADFREHDPAPQRAEFQGLVGHDVGEGAEGLAQRLELLQGEGLLP